MGAAGGASGRRQAIRSIRSAPTRTCARTHHLFGHRLIKTFNRFVSQDYIEQAKIHSGLAGIRPWKPKQFPHSTNYYANYNQDYFDTSKPSGYVWLQHRGQCPKLQKFIESFRSAPPAPTRTCARRAAARREPPVPSGAPSGWSAIESAGSPPSRCGAPADRAVGSDLALLAAPAVAPAQPETGGVGHPRPSLRLPQVHLLPPLHTACQLRAATGAVLSPPRRRLPRSGRKPRRRLAQSRSSLRGAHGWACLRRRCAFFFGCIDGASQAVHRSECLEDGETIFSGSARWSA